MAAVRPTLVGRITSLLLSVCRTVLVRFVRSARSTNDQRTNWSAVAENDILTYYVRIPSFCVVLQCLCYFRFFSLITGQWLVQRIIEYEKSNWQM